MKRLHSFAFYALVTPAIALGSGVVLAAQPTSDSEVSQGEQGYKQDQDATKSTTGNLQADKKMSDQAGMQSQSYVDTAPANGMHASKLIGAEVKTSGDENVGSVSDLIIDKNGQVVAIVIGVGGFLGMGEKSVAISWDKVMKSGTADKQELRIDESRDDLISAPEYKTQ
ncbi:PRC-barrel domain-containing protein [Marinobacter subterrani]|uniref:Sporulation protein YlmC, PRC-barrel domain family n=1 Tax=Marinobacter subterrani TaxID=1658765 RepID=A0A0J7LZP7_9GAMM|nr:PRC-barrel domain-containing protein [Marinobacter subterrani]KMQ74360.1 Sporulation protein YlmC, PRC-barrel domain family [Marinobacter subterrani]